MTDDSYAPPTRRRGRGFVWSLVLLLGGFAGGMLGSPWFEQQVRTRLPDWAGGGVAQTTSTADSARFASLEARIAAAERAPLNTPALPADVAARISALEARRNVDGDGAATLAADLGPLGNRMTAVEERLKVLEPAVQTATTAAAQIGAADARISALQTALAEQSARLRAFASLAPLRRALNTGTPAAAYVDALAAAVPAGSGDISVLRAAAAHPITLIALQKAYAQRRALVETRAGQAETKSGDSWLSTAMSQARALISDSAAKSAAAGDAVVRGEAALRRGDVETAMRLVRAASSSEQQRFNDWLVDAERFIAVRAALIRIETSLALNATASVTPPGSLPPAPAGTGAL